MAKFIKAVKNNLIPIYFGMVVLTAAYLLANEYAKLDNLKAELVEVQQAVSDINSIYDAEGKKLLDRIHPYEVLREKKVVEISDIQNVQSKLAELGSVLNKFSGSNSESSSLRCLPNRGSVFETCQSILKVELLSQEVNYLKLVEAHLLSQYNFDRLTSNESTLQSEVDAKRGDILENESLQKGQKYYKYTKYMPFTNSRDIHKKHLALLASYQSSEDALKINHDSLEKERERLSLYQSSNEEFTLLESSVQNIINPLYSHIYDTRNAISSHWISRTSSVFGDFPLPVVILVIFSLTALIVQVCFRYADQLIASSKQNRAVLKRVTILMIFIFCIPLLSILAVKWNQHAERTKELKLRHTIISALYNQIDTAQVEEEKVITQRASMLSSELLARKDNEESISKFAHEMLSFKSQWFALRYALDDAEHQKLVSKKFSDLIVSQTQIESQYKKSLSLCLMDIESIENKMLVSIGHDSQKQNQQRMLINIDSSDIGESIARVALESKHDAWKMTGTTLISTIASFLVTFNPIAVVSTDVAANLAAEKLLSEKIMAMIGKEIDSISERSSSQFQGDLLSYTRQRNGQIKRSIGEEL